MEFGRDEQMGHAGGREGGRTCNYREGRKGGHATTERGGREGGHEIYISLCSLCKAPIESISMVAYPLLYVEATSISLHCKYLKSEKLIWCGRM